MKVTGGRTISTVFLFLITALVCAQPPQNAGGELETLARALVNDGTDAAYNRLTEFAKKNAASEAGAQAALALGNFDHDRKRYDAAMQWHAQAEKSALLREYALFLGAESARAAAKEGEAIVRLERLRSEFPSSVLKRNAAGELAGAALALGQPQKALAAIDAHGGVSNDSWLLLLRGKALQQLNRDAQAAADLQAVHYGFPLSSEAKTAEAILASLRRTLGAQFPKATVQQQLARADALFERNRCREARAEYTAALPRVAAGAARDRAQLRIARCRIRAGAPINVLSALKVASPEADGERLYALSQTYRARRQESAMLAAVEKLAAAYPASQWTEQAFFDTGNFYWVELERAKAADWYNRTVARFPNGRNAVTSHWRAAWTVYLERPAQAAARFEEHLTRYRTTPYGENALYWLGRLAERDGNAPRARAFYAKAFERFTQTYYGRQAADRIRAIGPAPAESVELLARIPVASPAPPLDESIPPAAEPYRRRAQALLVLGLEAHAEQELRAAFAQTRAPRLLLEAAQAAHQASRHGAGIVIARRVDPHLDSRALAEAPAEIWRAVYPLPYQESIESTAGRKGLDPMLVAGLIRQESTFLPDAISRAGAVGLMQVLPSTGRALARRERLPYSRHRLFDPEYNLRLGTLHLANLVSSYGSIEKALAAYNAGEHRVSKWTAGGDYAEPAEFVESIPFTETREYVQIVMRNAEVYRRLYGADRASAKSGQ
jgi:soluble lytic murein transglycosylase